MYQWLYLTHVTCVILSGSFFVLRGLWMLSDSLLLSHRFVRVAPHVIDTLLLLSALSLAWLIGQYPFVQAWLTVKVIALVAYIGLGMVALRAGSAKSTRAVAFVGAIVVFAFMVSVALTHHPMGMFYLLT